MRGAVGLLLALSGCAALTGNAAYGRRVVVAASGNASASALNGVNEALVGSTVVDGSLVKRALLDHGDSLIPVADFGGWRARPPAGWPKPLDATWTRALEHCRALVGPGALKDSQLFEANNCSRRIALFLWQAYLDNSGAETVIEVRAQNTEQQSRVELMIALYEFGARNLRFVSAVVPADEVSWKAQELTRLLFDGKGNDHPRFVVRDLGSPVEVPFAGESVLRDAVDLSGGCTQLPSELKVTPDGVLAQTLSARWAESTKGGAPAQTCTLTAGAHTDIVVPMYQTEPMASDVVAITLTCGERVVTASRMKQALALPNVSRSLIEAMARRFCDGP